jgi:hypothetical protein
MLPPIRYGESDHAPPESQDEIVIEIFSECLVGEYKLDWFFVKGLATDSKKPGGKDQFAPYFGWTLTELNNAPDDPLSDHSPITVDLPLTEPHPR